MANSYHNRILLVTCEKKEIVKYISRGKYRYQKSDIKNYFSWLLLFCIV